VLVRLVPTALVAALLTLAGAAGGRSADGPTLVATVGSGFEISLTTTSGAPVQQLEPGTYTITVDDRSDQHDFHLVGPGVRRNTEFQFVGTQTWSVTLEDGFYSFYCSPHQDTMHGDFTVGNPPSADALAVGVDSEGRVSLRGGSTTLAPGRYSFTVEDNSTQFNVRLTGPAVELHTQNHIARTVRWTVTLLDGTYRLFADRRPEAGVQLTVGTPPPAGEPRSLTALTGPDFAIALLGPDREPVTRLDPGLYRIGVEDFSSLHNFHLLGPRVNRSTTLAFTGSETWEVELRAGAYSFICDPHTQTMTGSFRVGAPPSPARRLSLWVSARGALRGPRGTLPGGSYAVTVNDASSRHNVHVIGPGVNRKTAMRFRGRAHWSMRLASGIYRYRSDARPRAARSFRVSSSQRSR
jgi:plastocyanin